MGVELLVILRVNMAGGGMFIVVVSRGGGGDRTVMVILRVSMAGRGDVYSCGEGRWDCGQLW